MAATISVDHLPRGVSASTTGIFVLDVLALATMASCVPTLKLFVTKRRHWNLVSGFKEALSEFFWSFSLSFFLLRRRRRGGMSLSVSISSDVFFSARSVLLSFSKLLALAALSKVLSVDESRLDSKEMASNEERERERVEGIELS